MRRLPHFIPALVLTIFYLLIVLSPLAPFALQSVGVTSILTGECTGDCNLCRCSAERSANHTCCCWQKKLSAVHDEEQNEPACCKKKPSDKTKFKTILSSRPCSSKASALVGVAHGDVFPYRFITNIPVMLASTMTSRDPYCRIDWPGEPPDPPPKLSRQT